MTEVPGQDALDDQQGKRDEQQPAGDAGAQLWILQLATGRGEQFLAILDCLGRVANNLEFPLRIELVQLVLSGSSQVALAALLPLRRGGRVDGEQVLARMRADDGPVDAADISVGPA